MADKSPGKEIRKNSHTNNYMIAAVLVVAVILVAGSLWVGASSRRSMNEAVHNVSIFYLDELAGRREQVIASNLEDSIRDIYAAVGLMDNDDLSDSEHLRAFQKRMKTLYDLDKFAFVDNEGLIYTSKGTQNNIAEYSFDYRNLKGPEISVKDPDSKEKKVVIAVPVEGKRFNGKTLSVCFMEIDMNNLLTGVSLQPDSSETTFCNIYTADGKSLTNVVLGGLASEDNLLEAMDIAVFEEGNSAAQMRKDFANGREGVASFTYGEIYETIAYIPVEGTDWMLTYLIRESLISDQISAAYEGVLVRSILQTLLTAAVLMLLFTILLRQTRNSAALLLEKETIETENRIKQEELERRIELQEKLIEKEHQKAEQDDMIKALASEYKSVYYVDLDNDESTVYRQNPELDEPFKLGDHFPYMSRFQEYCNKYIEDEYRDGFMEFIKPESIRKALEKDEVISYRYLINRNGRQSYEMLRMAGVKGEEAGTDGAIRIVGAGFSDVDAATRDELARNHALSDALAAAEDANKAKTAFLSNMSHEIRTPMNAIIGLDSIALNDENLSGETREHLEKIGSSARHLLDLINDILDMSRIESGRVILKHEEFSFSKLIEHVNTLISGQCRDKQIDYSCNIKGAVSDHYIGDDMKLRQILINILSNAVKFTPEGGNVSMSVEQTAHFDDKSVMRFEISDTGIGIDKDFLPKIFDAFSQEDSSSMNKYGSSGLGLAITKNIVEMMNGDISVVSEKGKGSTFTVTVTLMDSGRDTIEEETHDIDPADMCVLIVDDDQIACEHAQIVLEKVGIVAETALSGEEAIEMVKLRQARMNPYNLILVDWKMPEMDGVETTRRIRSIIGNETAIIILTAYSWDDVLEEALEAGVDTFIAKPLFAANVIEQFTEAIKKKNPAGLKSESKTDLKGRRILMAEDVQVNAEIMTMLLTMKEIEVDHAENGRIALEKFESHPEGWYDAILMDMRMPEMDGLTATQKIRASGRSDSATIPIIALTANAFDEDVQRSLQAGLNAHLSKPVDPEMLFSTLESMIRD